MKMSKENYEVFMRFVNHTIENATDKDMMLLFAGLKDIAMIGVELARKESSLN